MSSKVRKRRTPSRVRSSSSLARPRKWSAQWILAAVVAVSGLVGLRAIGNQFVYDDHEMILLNHYIGNWSFVWESFARDVWWFRDPSHLPQSSYYRPLQDVWLGLNYQLFGSNPLPWHITSLALHLVAAVLIFKLLTAMLDDTPAAIIAALFFGLLPVHAEAVVWPSAVPLLLAAVFEMAALYELIRKPSLGLREGALALLLYAGALLSHESAVVFPGIVFLYFVAFGGLYLQPAIARSSAESQRRGSALDYAQLRKAAVTTAPFAFLMLAYLVIRLLVLGSIAAPGRGNHMTIAQALMTIPLAYAHYLMLLALPWLAGPSHRVLTVTSIWSAGFLVPVGFLAAAISGAVLLLIGSPRRRFYLFCGAWIVIGLIPEMDLRGLVQHDLVHDRYLYFPSAGFCFFLGALISEIRSHVPSYSRIVYGVTAAAAAYCGFLLLITENYWHDEVTLFSRAIQEFPDDSIWHTRLGMALQQRGEPAKALHELDTAHRLDPNDAVALFDLGQAHARFGNFKLAENETSESLKKLPNQSANEYVSLATIAAEANDPVQTESALKKAEGLPGGKKEGAIARAQIALAHKDSAAALAILTPLSESYADDARVWSLLGAARAASHDYNGAFAAYNRAITIEPGNAMPHYFAAQTLHEIGRGAQALNQCRIALALAPNDPQVLALLREIEAHN